MPKQHTYVLGLNTYDHDVSACLLRDGVIAFAIGKERLTREKHATGFYKEVIDYCLDAHAWARVNALYLHTSSRKWGRPYLTPEFFAQAPSTVGAPITL